MGWVNLVERIRDNPPTEKEIERVVEYRRRKAKARFYADENFPVLAVEMLRKMGARVVTNTAPTIPRRVGSKMVASAAHI